MKLRFLFLCGVTIASLCKCAYASEQMTWVSENHLLLAGRFPKAHRVYICELSNPEGYKIRLDADRLDVNGMADWHLEFSAVDKAAKPLVGGEFGGPDGPLLRFLARFVAENDYGSISSLLIERKLCYEIWPELRKRLVPAFSRESGNAISVSKEATELASDYYNMSPPAKLIAQRSADKLHLRVLNLRIGDEELRLRRDQYSRPWDVILDRDDLGLTEQSAGLLIYFSSDP